MPKIQEAPAVASLRAMAKQARGGGFLSGDDRQAAADRIDAQADAVADLIESARLLSLAAQMTGGVAGADPALQEAIERHAKAHRAVVS